MSYRHALVDVLEIIEDARASVDESEAPNGETEEAFEEGYLAALDAMEEYVLEAILNA